MFPPHWFQEHFCTLSTYFLGILNKRGFTVSTKSKKGILEARQFFFQINTEVESKLIPTTVANVPIHTLQKPTDWPEKEKGYGEMGLRFIKR